MNHVPRVSEEGQRRPFKGPAGVNRSEVPGQETPVSVQRKPRQDFGSTGTPHVASAVSSDRLWVKGRHEVLAALQRGLRFSPLFLMTGTKGPEIEQISALANNARIRLEELPPEAFKSRVGMDAQGVAGELPAFPYASLDDILSVFKEGVGGIILALNHLEDARNLGAITRTAAAAGVKGIIIPRDRAAGMTEWAVRTSQGAAFALPIARVTNISESLRTLKDHGFWAYGLSETATHRFDQVVYPSRAVIVAGGEDQGLGNVAAKACDELVSIPMKEQISSLNVSVSVAILLYEVLRQGKFAQL